MVEDKESLFLNLLNDLVDQLDRLNNNFETALRYEHDATSANSSHPPPEPD